MLNPILEEPQPAKYVTVFTELNFSEKIVYTAYSTASPFSSTLTHPTHNAQLKYWTECPMCPCQKFWLMI